MRGSFGGRREGFEQILTEDNTQNQKQECAADTEVHSTESSATAGASAIVYVRAGAAGRPLHVFMQAILQPQEESGPGNGGEPRRCYQNRTTFLERSDLARCERFDANQVRSTAHCAGGLLRSDRVSLRLLLRVARMSGGFPPQGIARRGQRVGSCDRDFRPGLWRNLPAVLLNKIFPRAALA